METYDKNKLFTARAAILNGEPVPKNVLDELIKLTMVVLGPPPAHMWPKGDFVIEPEIIGGPDLNPIPTLPNTDWQVKSGNFFPMVGVFFTREEFILYVKSIGRNRLGWNPIGSCMHHTANPH